MIVDKIINDQYLFILPFNVKWDRSKYGSTF